MKKIFAALVAVWYLVSTMGLDIHTDVEHGHTFVVPGIMAQSCEMIHPHEHCHDTSDSHSGCQHEEGCDEDEDCCTDDFESVSITGTDSGSQYHQQIRPLTTITVFVHNITKPAIIQVWSLSPSGEPHLAPPDIPVLNCVFRA